MTDAPFHDPAVATLEGPRALRGRLALLLVRAGDLVAQLGDAALGDELGITGRAYTALAVIDRDQPSSQLELARLMGKAPAMAVGLLDELESAGLVERGRDPKDRRRSVVTLTAAGRKKLAAADKLAQRIEAQVLGDLDDDLRAQLTAALENGAIGRGDAPISDSSCQ